MMKAEKGLVASYLDRARELRENHVTFVDVVAFGSEDAPVRVFAKKPTIADKSAIMRDARTDRGHQDPFEEALRTVIRLAVDEKGDALFTIADRLFLARKVDAEVIEHLGYRLWHGLSFEEAKKNSPTMTSSDTSSSSPSG
ncbi:MAG: hypothetical protein ACJA0Y_000188 [Maricaulis maris]|jgi:hypothetical protein|tara:strand:+ start:491 stop:913 length:423 start_codon:yes stop_codon:yes gene_type:complete